MSSERGGDDVLVRVHALELSDDDSPITHDPKVSLSDLSTGSVVHPFPPSPDTWEVSDPDRRGGVAAGGCAGADTTPTSVVVCERWSRLLRGRKTVYDPLRPGRSLSVP